VRQEKKVIEGGCLCGGIRYRYDGKIDEISICHCSQCRKAQGSAFAAVSPVATDRFQIIAGAKLLREYRSSPDKVRAFCANCGSPIYSAKDDTPGIRRLRLGTVDTPFTCANAFHIYTGSKASWWDGDDGLPRFVERKP
jgi:hypothetical protein